MKNYCQQYLKSLKHMVDEVDIGLTEREYHVLNGDEKINIIHQIMCEGVELLKVEARLRNYCEYNNKDFEDCLSTQDKLAAKLANNMAKVNSIIK